MTPGTRLNATFRGEAEREETRIIRRWGTAADCAIPTIPGVPFVRIRALIRDLRNFSKTRALGTL